MKKTYNPPRITAYIAGNTNKVAYKNIVNYQSKIANIEVEELVKKYGSPLYVFDESSIRTRYRQALATMQAQYPNSEITWSYKTNYLGAICSIYHQEGAKAEVVSGMEYDMAINLGVSGEDIIFNGPGKRYHELVRAVEDGAKIHIDHLDELVMLEKISKELDTKPNVAIRVNMDTGVYPQWQRFGFNYDNNEAYRIIRRIYNGGLLNLIGLHAHIGTFMLDAKAYYISAAKLLNLANVIKQELGIIIEYIDLGGGFASTNTLHAQYTPGEISSPTFDQFALAIGNAFNESTFAIEENPKLILETGRTLIDESGSMISSVIGRKNLPTGIRALIMDAGVNLLFTTWWYNLKFTPAQPLSGTSQATIFYGPLCMNIDVVKNTCIYPDMKTGDKVVIHPIGAYNVTQWMQFIEYRPNVVLVCETGEVELIRKAEKLDNIISNELIPEHLRAF